MSDIHWPFAKFKAPVDGATSQGAPFSARRSEGHTQSTIEREGVTGPILARAGGQSEHVSRTPAGQTPVIVLGRLASARPGCSGEAGLQRGRAAGPAGCAAPRRRPHVSECAADAARRIRRGAGHRRICGAVGRYCRRRGAAAYHTEAAIVHGGQPSCVRAALDAGLDGLRPNSAGALEPRSCVRAALDAGVDGLPGSLRSQARTFGVAISQMFS
ncbi:hypothetical protein FJT64_000685 [Amphibalanus amphitrite]|uniref:Uncharacterized protein n=1 Tax=Amphibalanus amphitrite TaxID=1232801 RepID=A0A6A4VZC0_AMPAM|nr:hypothetical protein FJT64_000685 [Amphibalanus amphitrite]